MEWSLELFGFTARRRIVVVATYRLWNGHLNLKPPDTIDLEQVESYFKNIFQSEITKNHPTIVDIRETLDNHDVGNHLTDYLISMHEVRAYLKWAKVLD